MGLTLYYHPLSSYCHKVLIALYEGGTAFDARLIDLGNESDRAELGAQWALCKFPVIHDGQRQRSVPESSVIIEYLDRHFPGPVPMVPADPDAAIDVRLWDRIFDNYLQTPLQDIVRNRIVLANADMSGHFARIEATYRVIDRRMASRTWAGHEQFSLADCAAAPALFYTNTLLPIPSELGHLGGYFERLMARPSVRRTLDEARPWFKLYPFADSIPERFR